VSRWFRLYDELLDDPKVQRLPGEDFKAWVNILCLASRNDGALPALADISFALRTDEKKTAATLGRLVSAGLLDKEDDRFSPHGWNARQYKSDVSTERVKRFRKRSKTADETPPETDTETEVPLSKESGAEPDSDQVLWSNAKDFLKPESKNPGALVGKWVREHGKVATAEAITRAQLERPVQRIPFIEGCFRAHSREPVVPL
jgi:hypothetical protein